MPKVQKLSACGCCIALCVILPLAFHAVPNAGSIFLPMHIPVLVCGLLVGWQYGLACGAFGPLLSSLMTGMPPLAYLPGMVMELAIYGLTAGLLNQVIHIERECLKLYIALIGAMLAGRLVMGLANAAIFRAGSYTFQIWTAGSFVTALPGIVVQLLFIPSLIFTLRRNGLGGMAHANG